MKHSDADIAGSSPVGRLVVWYLIEQIRARDAACMTYTDGTIHSGEGGDNVADDRRVLLQALDRIRDALREWRADEGEHSCDDDHLHSVIDEVCGQ